MSKPAFLPREKFDELLAALRQAGYGVVGPTPRDGAIVYAEVTAVADLPAGVSIDSGPGYIRLHTSDSPRVFAWANGPQALKPLLFKSSEVLWRAERDSAGRLTFRNATPQVRPTAVIGVRACDLAALQLQDRHFLSGEYRDTHYAARREQLFLVAVNCSHPAPTCFCASTGDGPAARDGYDMVLDELDDGFLVTAGSDRGAGLLRGLELQVASDAQCAAARLAVERAHDMQTRQIPAGDLYDGLSAQREHARWQDVAQRCLACGNCTLVCPSCFCSREQDESRLDGEGSEHLRQWDSCFSEGHSYIHGMVMRKDVRHRYRQWLTHKLGSWHRQYGRSGCVGCGRCIAWCPVGIDICEEVNAILGGQDVD